MTITQHDKAQRFQALHAAPGVFVMPNPWDGGSARILQGLGFAALATSSGAAAGTLGRRDGAVSRDEALAMAKAIVDATDLPVSADLENGFGAAPQDAAETIRRAAGIGLVGGSIEDATGDAARPCTTSTTRPSIAAAAEAAQAQPFPFVLTARAENSPARQAGSRRRPPPAGLSPGADVLFAQPARSRCGARRLCSVDEAGQLHGRDPRPLVLGGRAAGRRRQTHQPRDLALPRRDDRARECGARGGRSRHLRLPRPGPFDDARDQRLPASMSFEGRTARLAITPLRAAHAPLLFPLLADPRQYQYVPGCTCV
jgi:hypothetical protein